MRFMALSARSQPVPHRLEASHALADFLMPAPRHVSEFLRARRCSRDL